MNKKAKIIAIGGLPGSGKTTLADALAIRLSEAGNETIALDADRIRKKLWGVDENTPLPDEAYVWEVTEQVIFEIDQITKKNIAQGINVIKSATFITENTRQRQEDNAKEVGADFIGIFLTCDTNELQRRLIERQTKNKNASDAGLDVLEKLLKEYTDVPDWKNICSNQEPEKILIDTIKALNIPTSSPSFKNAKKPPFTPTSPM